MKSTLQEEIALDLYFKMLRIRMIEESIADHYKEQKMRCPVHLSIGQEAVAVGVCSQLTKEDYLISNHRAHAHYLAKGGNLKRMIAEIYGKSTGCCKGRGGSMHLVDLECGMVGSTPIVGGSIPVGVGISFASQLKNEKSVTTIFVGEGATEEGVFAESLNFAALRKLPLLFVCENNLYSVYSPLSVRQPQERNRVEIAKAHGFFAKLGDGNNVEEVTQITGEALSYIKSGKGPAYIEFSTYRFREHCGPNFDNHIGYRTEEEYLNFKNKCSLAPFESNQEWREKITHEINEAFDFAEKSPFPEFDLNAENPYARNHDTSN